MRHFFHQTNKSFYLHSLIFNVVSVKADRKPNKVDSILMPHKQKSREALYAKVFEKESKTNNEHIVAVLCLRHDFILLYHFFDFFVF